ncbi:Stc1 domain-containing protein [Aspergillus carlsbadensis]|nr:Stc1 domain-containing protein [Aspergillus carlsbadensis]
MNRRLSSGVPNAYSGGFSESIQRQLERVNLPDKIKCKTCHKWRLIASFSKRQLSIVRHAVYEQGNRALSTGHASCLTCTNGQITELTCVVCEQTKALDGFANNQRKEHENARCLRCVQGHADAEPVVDENKLLTDSEFSTTLTASHAASLSGSTRPFTSSTQASALNGYTTAEENHSMRTISLGGNNSVEAERYDTTSSHAHDQLGLTDGASVHSEWGAWGVTTSRAPSTVATDDRHRKFAKIKAWKPEPIKENVAARAAPVTKAEDNDNGDDEEEDGWEL